MLYNVMLVFAIQQHESAIMTRKWQYLPRESHGERSLVGYSPPGCKYIYIILYTYIYDLLTEL